MRVATPALMSVPETIYVDRRAKMRQGVDAFCRNARGQDWETRNLRMASNIRDVLGMRPGMRMLVVVGASHKGYLEAYPHQMHDVRIVDTTPFLEAPLAPPF